MLYNKTQNCIILMMAIDIIVEIIELAGLNNYVSVLIKLT